MKGFHWRRVPTKPRTTVFTKMRKVAILPTLCTLANGVCGVTAIMFITQIGPGSTLEPAIARTAAGWLIFLAMIFDVLDGYLARRAGQASQFGAELDSLCDAVSFGAAPAIFLVQLGASIQLKPIRDLIYVIALLYVCCAILRLARFNVTTTLDDKSHRYFQGLPSPAAAGCIASLVVLRYNISDLQWVSLETADQIMAIASPIAGLAVALLMVSKIQYVHMANKVLHRRRTLGKVVQTLMVVMMVIVFREMAVGLCFWGYALYGPVRYLWTRWQRTALVPPPAPTPAMETQPSTN